MAYIEVHDDGTVNISYELPQTRILNLLSICQSWWAHLKIYRNDGVLLSLAPSIPLTKSTIWHRILANTVYNPQVTVSFTYEPSGPYTLESLKADIERCVGMGDDVLTQFLETHEIIAALQKADTFDKIFNVVQEMLGDENVA